MILGVIVILGAIGAAGYMMVRDNDEGSAQTANTTGEDTSTSEVVARSGSNKTKVKVCDILPISKVSSITGAPMQHTPDLTEEQMGYDDGDVWSSTCAFYDPSNLESSDGVSIILMEALSGAAKAELATEWDRIKAESGGVDISGFGDKAFKIVTEDDFYAVNLYYVMVGDTMIMASSGVGHGGLDEYGRMAVLSVEEKDAVTEEVLRHILPQL